MEIYSTWHVHILVHTTYLFDHKRHDVTALSWQNHAMINTSCGRMLVMVESTYVSVKIRFYASPWLRHQMETISALLTLCVGNSSVTGEFPSQGQWHVALMFSFICAWTNGCANNRDAGDLRHHRAHYDVTVMLYSYVQQWSLLWGVKTLANDLLLWSITISAIRLPTNVMTFTNVRNILYLPNSRINSIVG